MMTADGWNSYQIDLYTYALTDSNRTMHTIHRPLLILEIIKLLYY